MKKCFALSEKSNAVAETGWGDGKNYNVKMLQAWPNKNWKENGKWKEMIDGILVFYVEKNVVNVENPEARGRRKNYCKRDGEYIRNGRN